MPPVCQAGGTGATVGCLEGATLPASGRPGYVLGEGRLMSKTIRLLALLTAMLAATPAAVRADEVGIGHRIWYGVAAAALNVMPVVSVYASQRCLPGYVVCKLSFAGMGIVAAGTQLVIGGDLNGAERTVRRAVGGDWLVLPHHVATGTKADPYPEPARDAADMELPNF